MFRKKSEWEKRAEFVTLSDVREYIRGKMHEDMEGEMPKGLPPAEREKYRRYLMQLRRSLRACVYGESGDKLFVKAYIHRCLEKAGITQRERENLLPLWQPEKLSPARKFDILLFEQTKIHGKDAFLAFCNRWKLPGTVSYTDGEYYEITADEIERIFEQTSFSFSEEERDELLCDAVYEGFGHGIIDRLRDCRLDGVSGGVAGLPEQFFRYEQELDGSAMGSHSYDSVFVMFRGITVRLSFLSFESEAELRRVTKALLRFEAPGELSYYRPYMVNDMKDGSRVFACRPPFSESWAFFVRKFDSAEQKRPEKLILGKGAETLVEALRYFVGGGLHVAITGTQGSGKTTLLKALVGYINPKYNLRIEESVFELWMRKEFPRRNILTFRETDSVSLTEGLDAFRKTDGNCLMMGEIGTIQVAALMIELSQVSEQQLFTHHAMSTEKLIGYFQNALLRTGAFSDERLAKEQVTEAFQIHVLCEKDLSGRRYIKSVTEILPESGIGNLLFEYRDGVYLKRNAPTKRLFTQMEERMKKEDLERMRYFFGEGW